MISRAALKKIALTRLREAEILRRNNCYDGAVYLCGYVVETALKARICRHLKLKEYPDSGAMKDIFASHNFDRLLTLSGLSDDITLQQRKKRALFKNWSLLTSWTPGVRYKPIGSYTEKDAKFRINALKRKRTGFLAWLRKKW